MSTEMISYDPRGVLLPEHGLAAGDLADLAGELQAARDQVLTDARVWATGEEVPAKMLPLDAGFLELPERLLAEFREQGEASEVARIQATADRLAAQVDRVVVLGIGGSYMGARALLEALCHPYYNEMPRAKRNNRPRITFEGTTSTTAPCRG